MSEPLRPPRRRRALIAAALIGAALVGGGVAVWRSSAAQQAATEQKPAAAEAGVPVTVAAVTRQDVPVYLRGLGTVQAFNMVNVRARVDGTLMQLPFTEG